MKSRNTEVVALLLSAFAIAVMVATAMVVVTPGAAHAGFVQPTFDLEPGDSVTLEADGSASVYLGGYHGIGGHGANWEYVELPDCDGNSTMTVTNISTKALTSKYYFDPAKLQERGVDDHLAYEPGCN